MARFQDGGRSIGAPSTRLMARSLGALYGAGALLAAAWVALPHPSDGSDRTVLAMSATAMVAGLIMLSGAADRVPPIVFHLIIAGIQVVISVAYAAGGSPTNDIRFFYVWATPFACFFFRPRLAVLHLLWVAALFCGALVVLEASWGEGLRVFLMTFGTVAAVGLLVLWAAEGVRSREVALHETATHDPLTGLANRTLFASLADEALDRWSREGGQVFVVLADLDRFKVINDTHGHHAGDVVLVALAPRIIAAAPPGATVARMGGDEFAILVDDRTGLLDPDDVLERVSGAWSRPIDCGRGSVHTSAALGLAIAAPGDTPSSLLRDADAAMYTAKASGRGELRVYDGAHRESGQRRFGLEQALHEALARSELHLAYQPIVDLENGELMSAEVLLRWTHPVFGAVSPAEFIPLAEEIGLIVPIGRWVLEEAIGQLGRWRTSGKLPDHFTLSVNVSGHQLRGELPVMIARTLRHHDVPARVLTLELTESVILDPCTETMQTLSQLRDMGIALALDDFGTGFSSLAYLQRTRFDAVKIDRSFVNGLTSHGNDRSIVTAILALATSLDMHAIAEGVETVAQQEMLIDLGCRHAQGYYFDRPMPADELSKRLAASRQPTLRVVPAVRVS